MASVEPAIEGVVAPWEPVELLGAGVLVATLIYFGVLIAVGALRSIGPGTTGTALVDATGWANPVTVLLPLAVLGAAWWQARQWPIDDDVDRSITSIHRARARRLGGWSIVPLAVAAVAAVGAPIGYIILDHELPSIGTSSVADYVQGLGGMVATVVMCGVVLLGALQLRAEFTDAEVDAEVSLDTLDD